MRLKQADQREAGKLGLPLVALIRFLCRIQ